MRCCPGAKHFSVPSIRVVAIAAGAGVFIGCLAIESTESNGGAAAGPPPVASVSVSPATASLPVGETVQLAAAPKDSAGSALTGRTVTWASSYTDVATVNSSGRVTGGSAGSATITATSEGKAGSATVTVTLVPVASVVVSPATATLPVGGTVQLIVTLKDADGHPLTGRSVAWTSSAPTVATVSPGGLVTDVATDGTATITATSEGESGMATVTVQAPLPAGAGPDPTLLPVAARQAPNLVAYTALGVAARPAGFSYNDPVSGVKVWKVTSATTPAPNAGAGHDYADGANQVSRGWGANNNTHTLLIRGAGMAYYLVDFTRGAGFSNYRVLPPAAQPKQDLRFSFSSLVSQPRIAYVINDGQLKRFNTATMQVENTGNFPLTTTLFGWLQQDKNDEWFVGLADQQTAFAWNSRTNQLFTHVESWLNEPRLERDGRYVILTNTQDIIRLWDLSTNTFGPQQSAAPAVFYHNANLRGQWISTDPNLSAPFAQDRYTPSGGQITRTQILAQSAGDVHHAGNWIQSDAELGGNLNRQWSFISGFNSRDPPWQSSLLWNEAIGVQRSDGSDQRLLLHHYSLEKPLDYWTLPFGMPSPDGKVVIFNSNMGGSGRYDLFIAEMPLR